MARCSWKLGLDNTELACLAEATARGLSLVQCGLMVSPLSSAEGQDGFCQELRGHVTPFQAP